MTTPNLRSGDVTGIVELILQIILAAIPTIDALRARFGAITAVDRENTVLDLVQRGLAPVWPDGRALLTLDPGVDSAARGVIAAVVVLHKAVAAAQVGDEP